MRKIDEREIEFLKFCFPEHEKYNGNILFYMINRNKSNPVFQDKKTFIGFSPINKIEDLDLKFYNRPNYYLTQNTYKKTAKKENYILSLNNIVIRLYDVEYCFPETIFSNHSYLTAMICSDSIYMKGIPEPNFIVDCGNAIEIWYSIEQTAANLKWIYESVAKDLCDRYSKMISREPSIKGMRVDKKRSCNIQGLFMMPGTFNYDNKLITCVHVGNDRINILEYYKDILQTETSRFVRNINKKAFDIPKKKFQLIATKRIKMFENMIDEVQKGKRDKFLFCIFCTAIHLMGTDKALEFTLRINMKLKTPMKVADVLRYLKTAIEKKYKISNKKIMFILNIDASRMAMYGLYSSKNNLYIPKTTADERKNRNKKILHDAKRGMIEKAIAQKYKLSESRISKILGLFNFDPIYWRRKTRIIKIRLLNIISIPKIKEYFRISKPTAYSLIEFIKYPDQLKKRKRNFLDHSKKTALLL